MKDEYDFSEGYVKIPCPTCEECIKTLRELRKAMRVEEGMSMISRAKELMEIERIYKETD